MSPRESNRTKNQLFKMYASDTKDLGTVLTGPADHLSDY